MPKILLVNGPNLGRLGVRKPEIYGKTTLQDVTRGVEVLCVGIELLSFHSNHEGEIIDFIEKNHDAIGLIINPGALMMSGWSLRDCLEDFGGHKVEVHISNVWARESFRHESVLSAVVNGVIAGLGVAGYGLAAKAIMDRHAAILSAGGKA